MTIQLTIDGRTAPAPNQDSFEAKFNPQQSSAERTGNGAMSRTCLPDKWSLDMEWTFGSPEELYAWFNVLKGLTRKNFVVTFPAPTGNMETATFYIAPISAKMLNMSRGAAGWYRTIKTSFIEV